YNKVKNNLRRLFFTQGSQTRNVKFDQVKFNTLKAQVSVRQIRFRRKFTASDLRAYFTAFARKRGEFIAAKAKSGKMR
uniref:hypothetical protein n=1 Tax=uncultured Campylobacter sp. TaxID=218934 RepID=UPI002619F945